MKASPAAAKASEECEQCRPLREQLEGALLELAREREKVSSLRLGLPPAPATEASPNYPASATPGAPPLRYVLVDAANERITRYLGPVQRLAKTALKALNGWSKDEP